MKNHKTVPQVHADNNSRSSEQSEIGVWTCGKAEWRRLGIYAIYNARGIEKGRWAFNERNSQSS